MNFKHIKAVLLTLTLACTSANATLITHESRSIAGGFSSTDLLDSWNALSNTITSKEVTSFVNVRPGNNKLNILTLDFNTNYADTWTFEAGLDAGLGAEFYLNGNLISSTYRDLWWSNNWNSRNVFAVNDLMINEGKNTIQIVWAEGCCNGGNSIRFTDFRGEATLLTTDSLRAASVPEPQTIALLGAALLGLRLRSRK